jgi:type VI secretion system protein ImpG
MFNRYYQQELLYLRDLAAEFSKAHPALAPTLSGQATDPDVERLLEGVAFSTGLIRQKLDDELPEIIHGLTDLVFPHYLRPLPAASVVAFSPKPALKEPMTVEKGTSVASLPAEGTSCTFQTAYDVTVHPLTLAAAEISEESARSVHIRLSFSLLGLDLSAWRPGVIRFFLGGDYAEAADRYLLLNRSLRRIRVESPAGGAPFILDPSHLRPAGFSRDESLIPYPGNAFSGYRLIQEYFLMPAAFLFMDLAGLDGWENRGAGDRFDVVFEMADPPFFPRDVRPEHFILFATPVVNLFRHTADPIDLDHRLAEYPVRPSGRNERHYQVYSVERVTGIIQGSVRRKAYAPFERFAATGEGEGVFQVSRKPSAIDNRTRVFLNLPYSGGSGEPVRETLAVELICTNGELPQTLQLGDISAPTSESPVLLDFRNITPVTAPVEPSLGTDALWRLLSHLSLNFLPLSSADALRELLSLYVFPESRDKAKVAANRKRIEGIEGMTVTPEERLVSVHMMRGQRVHIDLRRDHFASAGDAFLFGCVLERFLSVYASINTFTRLSVRDTIKGDVYQWEPRIGGAPLI